jgi:hypothetical protein
MNYTELKALALAYSDREDTEVINRIDDFLRVVEARLSRKLKVGEMSTRSITNTIAGDEYYSLPDDFAGLRDIEIKDSITSTEKTTLKYVTPEKSNYYSSVNMPGIYYTIVANQIQLIPAQQDNIMEVIYYKKLTPLSAAAPTNWLSINFPDCYLFGIMTEICAFVKDSESAKLWDARYVEAITEIEYDDKMTRWSGPSLQITTD